eukprot:1175697-Prorocentrum_minimum.AAC.2
MHRVCTAYAPHMRAPVSSMDRSRLSRRCAAPWRLRPGLTLQWLQWYSSTQGAQRIPPSPAPLRSRVPLRMQCTALHTEGTASEGDDVCPCPPPPQALMAELKKSLQEVQGRTQPLLKKVEKGDFATQVRPCFGVTQPRLLPHPPGMAAPAAPCVALLSNSRTER